MSSGHTAYKGDGGFRNTPITLAGERREVAAPGPSSSSSVLVDEMTPTEAEIMLSTELTEKRKESILSDEQAEEVVALLTPEKELPPLPFGEKQEEPSVVTSSDIGSSIESYKVPPESALDKLDNLVYNKATAELQVNEEEAKKDEVWFLNTCPKRFGAADENWANSPWRGFINHRMRRGRRWWRGRGEAFYDEVNDVHVLEDGHYWFEIPAIDGASSAEELPEGCYKPPSR